MKVRATALGYYEHERRYPGDVFELKAMVRKRKDKDGKEREVTIRPEQQFSERWMEKVGEKARVERKPRPNKHISSPATLNQMMDSTPHQEVQEESTEEATEQL